MISPLLDLVSLLCVLFTLFPIQFLSTCIVGASLEEADGGEEEDEDKLSRDNSALQDGTFQIVGTVANEGRKASFALEQYSVSVHFFSSS